MSRLLPAFFSIIALTACPFRCMTECAHGAETEAVPQCECCHHEPVEEHEAPTLPSGEERDCSCLCCNGGLLKPDGDAEHCAPVSMYCDDNAAVGSPACVVGLTTEPAGDLAPPGQFASGRAIRSRIMSLTI